MPALLLNNEGVVLEVTELARLKISKALSVSPGKVMARWKLNDGKMVPEFSVADADGMDKDIVRTTIGAVWRWLKDSLAERIQGLKQVRGG